MYYSGLIPKTEEALYTRNVCRLISSKTFTTLIDNLLLYQTIRYLTASVTPLQRCFPFNASITFL